MRLFYYLGFKKKVSAGDSAISSYREIKIFLNPQVYKDGGTSVFFLPSTLSFIVL
jgi:hypothetical protein